MYYEQLPDYQSVLGLLVRVSNLSSRQDERSAGDFHALKAEIVSALTFIIRAQEAAETESDNDGTAHYACAVRHLYHANIWLRVLVESKAISRFVFQQLSTSVAGIINNLSD